MSDVIVDAGGHDHGGHLHAGHGGDGASVAQLLGLNDHPHGHHGVLGHLFSQDGAHGHGGHHHHHVGQFSTTPQGSISWSSALRSMKLSDALQGIYITPNMLFLFLGLGFALWLYVVYWVRHHEPLANQVLGTSLGRSVAARADRQIVNGVKNAFPVRTGPTTGMIYVPNSTIETHYLPSAPPMSAQAAGAQGMAVGAGFLPKRQPAFSSGVSVTPGAYHVTVQTPDGLKLKTVVNR